MSDAEGLALITKLKLELRKDPKDWESWLHLAEALEKQTPFGWEEEAAASYEKVMELAPDVAAGYLGFAAILVEQFKDFEPAEAVLQRACEVAPDDVEPLISLGALLYQHLHRTFDAYDAFSKALLLEPKDNDIRKVKVMVGLQKLGRPEWVKEDAEILYKAKPKDPEVASMLALIVADVEGDMERASSVLEGLRKTDQNNHFFWHNYGLYLMNHEGDGAGAKDALQRALLIDEECDSINDDLAYLHGFMGDMSTAWNYAQKVLMVAEPGDDTVLALIAHLNLLAGKTEGVLKAFDSALAYDADDREILALKVRYYEMIGASEAKIEALKVQIRALLPKWEGVDDYIARTFNPLA